MYGLKYQADFKGKNNEDYSLEIHEKDYSGGVTAVIGAGVPVIHKWNTDDPLAPVKGSSLQIKLINEGSLPLSSFYATDDEAFLVKFFHGTDLKFTGFLVQDDCSEDMLDYRHEIRLSANDNLGLLKDIDLMEAATKRGTPTDYTNQTIGYFSNNIIYAISWTADVQPGDILVLTNGPINGTYNVITAQPPTTTQHIQVTPAIIPSFPGTDTTDVRVIRPIDIRRRLYISELLRLCLLSTGLEINTRYFGDIFPTGAADDRLFDNVQINGEDFLNGERWDSCYKVLEDILGRLNASLMQAEGVWNIVRWHEARNGFVGYEYDTDFEYVGATTFPGEFTAGPGEDTQAETGLVSLITRPYKFVQEKMTYRNPDNLIKNINLTDLGILRNEYTGGPYTIREYALRGWETGYEWTSGGNGYLPSQTDNFIRTYHNADGTEAERFLVVKGLPGTGGGFACCQSNGVETIAGDRIKISFDFKTDVSRNGPINLYFEVLLLTTLNPVPRSVNNRFLNSEGKWRTIPDPTGNGLIHVNISSGDNSNQYHTVDVYSEPTPFTGLIIIKLAQCVVAPISATGETHYRNFSFEVIRTVGSGLNVKGHTHTDKHTIEIKNTQERDIQIDNTPSNSIAGTLFLPTFTGPVQNRTGEWNYNGNTYDKLGRLTTFENLFWKRISRARMEGTLYGLMQTTHFSILNPLLYTSFPNTVFVCGQCEIDYKHDNATGTFWEMYKDTEDDSDLVEFYEHKYIYK